MALSFDCPSCGTALSMTAGAHLIVCPKCGTTIEVAQEATLTQPELSPLASVTRLPADLLADLRGLLIAGKKTEAIALYQTRTNADFEAAKDMLESIQGSMSAHHIEALTTTDFPSDLLAELRNLLAQDQKLEAIRVFRERTNVGLKTAKEVVEAIERGDVPRLKSSPGSALTTTLPASVMTKVKALLERGHKMEAVKAYRDYTKAGLKEAVEAVEAIAAQAGIKLGASSGGGCSPGCLLRAALIFVLILGGCSAFHLNTDAYQCVLREVKKSPAALRVLGEPLSGGWLVVAPSTSWSSNWDGSSRYRTGFWTSLHGPQAWALLWVAANQTNRDLTFRASLYPEGQEIVINDWTTVPCP